MTIIVPIYDRIELLPFFLRFYQERGINRFVVALYNGDDNPLYWPVLVQGKKYEMFVRTSIKCSPDQYNGPAETPGINRIREEFVRPDEWFMIADLDEFVVGPARLDFPQLARMAEQDMHCLAVQGVMVDRIAADGQFPPIDPHCPLDKQFPLALNLTRCVGCTVTKIPLLRGDVIVKSGHHHVDGVLVWHNLVEVHHFKWTQGIQNRLRERLHAYRSQRLPWAEECSGFLKQMENGVNLQHADYKIRPGTLISRDFDLPS